MNHMLTIDSPDQNYHGFELQTSNILPLFSWRGEDMQSNGHQRLVDEVVVRFSSG